MPQEIQTALELQRMDRILHGLELEIRALPKKVQQLEQQLAEARRKREIADANLAANRQEMRRLEHQTQDHRAKIDKLKKQVMQATTQDQLTAFQHEIDFAEQGIAANEDALMTLLEALDELEAQALSSAAAEKEAQEFFERQKAEATARSEEDRKKGVKIFKERNQLHASLPPAFRDEYDRLRKAHKDGIVVADCSDGSCSGCLMTIRPALMQQIRSEASKIFRCESCHRWLVYNPVRSPQP